MREEGEGERGREGEREGERGREREREGERCEHELLFNKVMGATNIWGGGGGYVVFMCSCVTQHWRL